MKKLIAIIMVIAMVAALIPATFAKEAESVPATANKSQFDKTLDTPTTYGIDNYGNKQESGARSDASVTTDFSHVSKEMMSVSATSTKASSWVDSTHYGTPFFEASESLEMGYQADNSDFTESNDFLTSRATSYGLFFSPAASLDPIQNTSLTALNKGDKFWVNVDIISGYSATQGPTFYANDVVFSLYMYAGTQAQFQSDAGLPLSACWQGLTKISAPITVPANNQVYMFFIVVTKADMQDAGARGFGAWIQLAQHEKTYKEAKVQSTIVPGQQYTADLGGASSEFLLLNGGDIGNVLAYGSLYKVEVKAGDRYAITTEGNGKIGTRVMILDENKDKVTDQYLGTGAVVGGTPYENGTAIFFPMTTGTYHILIAGFCATDEGEIQFELVDYNEYQSAHNQLLPYIPVLDDIYIDLDVLTTEDVIETVGELSIWAYFYYPEFGMASLILAYPAVYHVSGEKTDMYVEIYDGVTIDLNNATVSTVWCCGSFAETEIRATGSGKIVDNYFGAALLNDNGYYAGVYLTGQNLEIAGELSNGALMEVPVHIYTKKLTASATVIQGSYTVAFWTAAASTPRLTWASGLQIKSLTGGNLKEAKMYFDAGTSYLNGYTISEYDAVHRYGGSPDYYRIADSFIATTNGIGGGETPPPVGLRGDANLDGKVNTGDATMVLKHVAELETLVGQGLKNADMNEDGKVNTGDATAILKFVVGN